MTITEVYIQTLVASTVIYSSPKLMHYYKKLFCLSKIFLPKFLQKQFMRNIIVKHKLTTMFHWKVISIHKWCSVLYQFFGIKKKSIEN